MKGGPSSPSASTAPPSPTANDARSAASLRAGPGADRVPRKSEGERLLEFLSSRLINESKTALRRLVGAGRILLNGHAAPTGERLRAGDLVSLPPGLDTGPPPDQSIPIEVLHQDADHLCIDKPAGWPVLPGRRGQQAEFYRSLVACLNRDAPPGGPYVRPHIVHRLDRETSGVLLVGRHVAAGRALSMQFQRRQVEKTYLCIVEGALPRREVELNVPLRRKPGSILQMEPATSGGTSAVTQVCLEEPFGHFSLLRLRPLTGRQHQIRVHLSAAGYPPLVDGLYGRREQLTGAELNRILGRKAAGEGEVLLGRVPLHAAALRYRPPCVPRAAPAGEPPASGYAGPAGTAAAKWTRRGRGGLSGATADGRSGHKARVTVRRAVHKGDVVHQVHASTPRPSGCKPHSARIILQLAGTLHRWSCSLFGTVGRSVGVGGRQPVLIVIQGPEPGIIYRLPENRVTTIGRSTRNSIVVVNPDVSRFHCELSYVNGRWELHDLNSKKGTIINGEAAGRQPPPDPRRHRPHEQRRLPLRHGGRVVRPGRCAAGHQGGGAGRPSDTPEAQGRVARPGDGAATAWTARTRARRANSPIPSKASALFVAVVAVVVAAGVLATSTPDGPPWPPCPPRPWPPAKPTPMP